MNSQNRKTGVPSAFIVLFLILSAISLVVGIIFYHRQKMNLLFNSTKELSAIADLKAKQIIQWRSERIADGSNFNQNAVLMKKFYSFLDDKNNKELEADLLQYLKGLTENYDYRDALFVDGNSNPVLSYPDRETVIGDYLASNLPDYIKNKEITLTDLHQSQKVSIIHLDLVVPMKSTDTISNSVFGALVLRIDPRKVLYPIINSWPSATITSEMILFHQEGDQILYLNELRHMPGSSLTLRKSITEENLAETQALLGMRETTDAVDYRGVKVIAAMKKIPESPWYLVAKTDRKEIFNSLRDEQRLILIIIVLFNLTTASFLGFVCWNQRVRFYKEKYEAELERMALVRHFDYILKYANDIILLIDNNFKIIEANDKALETYQYDRGEVIGVPLERFLDDKGNKIEKGFSRLDDMGYATFESKHKRRDGSTFPIEISARRVDIEGVKFYQAICRDITERKNAEKILKESEERFRKIFEESPLSIAMTDKDMGIIRANNAYCQMLGYTEEELSRMTYKDFTHPDDIQKDEHAIFQLVSKNIPIYHTEKRFLKKDDSLIWGSTTVSIVRNNNGEIQFFLEMVEDITSKVQAADELLAAKEKAEESDRLKTAFLHNVSHEIRTPMNAIMGFSTLLNDPELTANERIQFTDIIQQSGNQLLSIINDIVDLASIESGQMKVNLRIININRAMKSLYEQFRYNEKVQKVKMVLKTPLEDDNAEIMTDGTKLVQMLSNLINNALKFTPEGRIDIGYVLQDGFLVFSVKDTGIGIPPEFHSRVFERFYQVDNTVSRQYQGTGLGLSICKAYAELLGGKIWLESRPDNGTTFSFSIPYQKSQEASIKR